MKIASYFYTYYMSKCEKKYWKQVSDVLETSEDYVFKELKDVKDKKKRGIPIYYDDLRYVHAWVRFNPFTDIVVGVKV